MQKYTRSTFSALWSLIALGALAFSQTACPAANNNNGNNNNNNTEKPVLRIGAVFSDKGAANNSNVDAVKLAAQDLNESGVLSHQIQIVPRFFTPDTDIPALVKSTIDDDQVVAFTAELSSVAAPILRLTNTDAYAGIVQCNGASTNAPINDPTIPNADDGKITSDKNDTLFRTVGNDLPQNRLIWKLQEDADHVGILYVDDAFGNSMHKEFVKNAAADGKTLVLEAPFANDLQLAALQPTIDDILAKNQSGGLNTLVIVGLRTHGGALVKALVEAPTPFAGTIFLSASTLNNSVFSVQTGAFTQWLARPGNRLTGTQLELFSGDNSTAWNERYKAFTQETDFDGRATSHADCMYSFALALIEADVKGEDPAKFIKQGMINQKQENLAGDVVLEVTPDVAGLQAARQAFLEGKKVRLNGASGRIEYDNFGDRSLQFYTVMKVDGAGPYEWAVEQLWDPISNVCIEGCD